MPSPCRTSSVPRTSSAIVACRTEDSEHYRSGYWLSHSVFVTPAQRPRDEMTTFLVTIGIGLSTAAILSLSAVAFTLEYAVSRVANFAHGEFLTIGAYAAYTGQTFFHKNVAAAALIAAAAGMVAGLVLNVGLIEQFRGRTGIT